MKNQMNAVQIGIGIVTFNRLDLLQKCFNSWRAASSCQLVVFDNGSDLTVVEWLKRQPIDHLILSSMNMGLCYARNRLLEYFRDGKSVDFVLLADSDVKFHDGMISEMLQAMQSDQDIGFVGYAQSNKGFPVSSTGEVEEIANECQLTRLSMWQEIGLFPENLQYYSGDSWKSTIANMHGWKSIVISGSRGYDHFQHGSQWNIGVKEAKAKDIALWKKKEQQFIAYWRNRLTLGKGEAFRVVRRSGEDSDANIRVENYSPSTPPDLLIPERSGLMFTAKADVQAIVWLSKQVPGNLLEIGCHQGITTMQLAIQNPEKRIFAIDYSGPEPTMCPDQMNEQPTPIELGFYAKLFRNVSVFDERFDIFDLNRLEAIDFVFYDADLSYRGVKVCTEKVLEYFICHPVGHKRLIVWHDYAPATRKGAHPPWLRLGEYVRRELSGTFLIRYFEGTSVACLEFPASQTKYPLYG